MVKSKAEIRKSAKSAVKSLPIDQKESKSALIFKRILELDSIKGAKCVALYASLPDEVYSLEAVEYLSDSKRVLLPRVCGDDMDFYPYLAGALSTGAFGISEPQVWPLALRVSDLAGVRGTMTAICRVTVFVPQRWVSVMPSRLPMTYQPSSTILLWIA